MNFAVLELETLPDIEGGRLVHGLSPDSSDEDVARVMFHHLRRSAPEAACLPSHLQILAVVSLLLFRDEQVSRYLWSAPDADEQSILEGLRRRLKSSSAEIILWDGGRGISQLLTLRSMVRGCEIPFDSAVAMDRLLDLSSGATGDRVGLGRRLGITMAEPVPDEKAWKQYLATGVQSLTGRCLRNNDALARFWMSWSRATGRLAESDHELLTGQLDRLSPDEAALSSP